MLNAKTRLISLGVVLVALTLAPAVEAKAKHSYDAQLLTGALQTENGYPGVGGTAVLAGVLENSEFGSGATIAQVTIADVEANVVSFEGTEVDYYTRGSQRNKFTGTATIEGDGSQTLVIHGGFTGGTGAYKGAKGRYTFHGTTPPGGTVTTGSSHGSVRF
jgi:hypothetical protein